MKPTPIITTEADFAKVWRQYYKPLVFVAQRIVLNSLEAEDIVSSVFEKFYNIAVIQGKKEFTSIDEIKSFLYVSVRNLALDKVRDSNRHRKSHSEISATFSTSENPSIILENEIQKAELIDQILEAIESLPRSEREIFKAIFLDGRSPKELAQERGLSYQTILNQKAKATEKLRAFGLKIASVYSLIIHFFYCYLLNSY